MSEVLFDVCMMNLCLVWAIQAHLDGFAFFKWFQAVFFGFWVHWVVADSIAYFQLMP